MRAGRRVGDELVGQEAEGHLVELAPDPFDHAQRDRQQLVHPLLHDVPQRVVGGDVPAAGERAPRHVPTFVVTDATHQLDHAGQDVVADADLLPGEIAGQRQHSLDDVVVRDAGADLVLRTGIRRQQAHGVRQLIVEEPAVVRVLGDVRMEIIGEADGVHPAAEHLGVFGLLEAELRQIHLVAEASLGGHRGHERLDVGGDGFLAGGELRAQEGRTAPFVVRQPGPIRRVRGEVDVGGVPEFLVALDEQAQREPVPVEPVLAQGVETVAEFGGRHGGGPFSSAALPSPTLLAAAALSRPRPYDGGVGSFATRRGPRTALTLWRMRADGPEEHVAPDGVMDLMWFGNRLVVAGADTRSMIARTAAGEATHGLRLAPGLAHALLGVPADELTDQRVELSELVKMPARDGWFSRDPADALERVFIDLWTRADVDRSVLRLASSLDRAARDGLTVRETASLHDMPERSLRRISNRIFGYGPKTLAQIHRFQYALHLLRAGRPPSDAAATAGYVDQAHLNRETKRLTGRTPGTLA